MADEQDSSLEEVLASIRSILWEKEMNKTNDKASMHHYTQEQDMPVFELTKDMLVKGWALPYEYAHWNFDDVAQKILHKFANVFAHEEKNRLNLKKGDF